MWEDRGRGAGACVFLPNTAVRFGAVRLLAGQGRICCIQGSALPLVSRGWEIQWASKLNPFTDFTHLPFCMTHFADSMPMSIRNLDVVGSHGLCCRTPTCTQSSTGTLPFLTHRSCLTSLPLVGSANGVPGRSLVHKSVSGPHRGGQRPSPLAGCVRVDVPCRRWRNPLQRRLLGPGMSTCGVTSMTPQGATRSVNFFSRKEEANPSPLTPPPPQTKVPNVGKNEICCWENLIGPFLVHKFLGPRPPPPSLFSLRPPPPVQHSPGAPCCGTLQRLKVQ